MNFPVIQATLAFVFNHDLTKVLLIRKERPVAHAGLLNGLGGKVEAGESHLACVIRETAEESGLHIPSKQWTPVGTMTWTGWDITIWTSRVSGAIPHHFPEPNVAWYPTSSIPPQTIENLHWLIPLSLDIHRRKLNANADGSLPQVKIVYQ